jgi:GLPGLI family protein
MRKTMFITLLMLTCFNVKSQQLKIVYEAYMTSSIGESYRPEGANSNNHIIVMLTLRIANGISWFSKDSIFLKYEVPFVGFSPWTRESLYKNYNEDAWIQTKGIYMEGYAVRKKLSNEQSFRKYYDWQITDEKRMIEGVECIKAEAKTGPVAWFAPGIPYPDGPDHGTFNLPGLVLHFEEQNLTYTARSISFEQAKIIIPDFKYVSSEDSIYIHEGWKKFPRSKSIPLDKDTPLNQWLKFEN